MLDYRYVRFLPLRMTIKVQRTQFKHWLLAMEAFVPEISRVRLFAILASRSYAENQSVTGLDCANR